MENGVKSFVNPWKFAVRQVGLRKTKTAIDADILAASALDDVMKAYGEGEYTCRRPFEYKIINPLDESRKAVVLLPIDFWECDTFKKGFKVTDKNDGAYHCQFTSTLRGSMIAVEVELGPKGTKDLYLCADAAAADFEQKEITDITSFENQWYKVEWSKDGVISIINKETENELLNGESGGLGMPVYQVFPEGSRSKAGASGYKPREKPASVETAGKVKSVSVNTVGPVFLKLKAEYEVSGASCYNVYYTFNTSTKQIAVDVEMTKDMVIDPEGMYTTFPFQIKGGKWHIDKPGALILPGRDQLPGTCCDYYSVDRGAILSGDEEGIYVSTLDAPMVTIGGLKLWDFTTTINPTGNLYSWLCNNKWDTNFKADCGGFYEFRYIIEFSKEFSDPNKALEAMGQNNFEAFVVRK